MKATLGFDPDDYDYGVATTAIRAVLIEWAAIDWFEPTTSTPVDGESLYREHLRLAHARAPETFVPTMQLESVVGDAAAFVGWCERVRSSTAGWDWRLGALKQLSHNHAVDREWTMDAHARELPIGEPRAGDLFVRYGPAPENVTWNSLLPSIPIDSLVDGYQEAAGFYRSYAHADAFDCIKWQLAERSATMTTNPFLPLLLCYGVGAYPFSLGRDHTVLFHFTA